MMSRIAAWDADFIPFYVCHNKKDAVEEKTLQDCLDLCDNIIQNVNRIVGATSFVGFITKGKCFRYGIYPNYKGNRKHIVFPKYMSEVRAYMLNKYGFVGVEGLEADDLVVSFKEQNDDDIIIISPDKDLLNLEGVHYNPKTHKYIKTSKNVAERYFWTSMLTGDPGDNIKGCKGVGPVTAKAIIDSVVDNSSLRGVILTKYCEVYGENEGISEFYRNYKCLHILEDIDKSLFNDVKLNKIGVLSE